MSQSQFSAIPLSPGGPSRPRLPDTQAYHPPPLSPTSARSRRRSSFNLSARPKLEATSRPSFLDEILPTPSFEKSGGMRGLPTSSSSASDRRRSDNGEFHRVVRRSGSVGVLLVFLLVATWLAATDTGGQVRKGMREIISSGRLMPQEIGMVGQDHEKGKQGQGHGGLMGEEEHEHEHGVAIGKGGKPDYDQYVMLRTVPADMVSVAGHGRRVIIIGDVHGSFVPLQRLLRDLRYDSSADTLIHVGDIVAKGPLSPDVLDFMAQNDILGVRGNHDQPVVRWRAWMHHAGGLGWEDMMDEVAQQDEDQVRDYFKKKGKEWPKGWEWKGEHWKIARFLTKRQYNYLLSLPLTLHIPSLHSVVVHAGMVPYDLTKSPDAKTQPLIIADRSASRSSSTGDSSETSESTKDYPPVYDDDSDAPSTDHRPHMYDDDDSDAPSRVSRSPLRNSLSSRGDIRTEEELNILTSLPQNTSPYTLIEMRSLYTHGKKRGKITKDSKKGQPWAEVWNKQMKRCKGEGAWSWEEMQEELKPVGGGHGHRRQLARRGDDDDDEGEGYGTDEDEGYGDVEEAGLRYLQCSPFTVIYGHAAGRGLDIRPFSKGIDTGCVYGERLTALVLGDTASLKGERVKVDQHRGVLVSVDCEAGGKA